MENAAFIFLFWCLFTGLVLFTLVLLVVAIVLMKKGKAQNIKKIKLLGKICLALDAVCCVPIILVIGYILYLRFC